MILKRNDVIVCVVKYMDDLTYGKEYTINDIMNYGLGRHKKGDVSILDDRNKPWWFGQLGCDEPWDMFFVSKLQWDRTKKIDNLVNE